MTKATTAFKRLVFFSMLGMMSFVVHAGVAAPGSFSPLKDSTKDKVDNSFRHIDSRYEVALERLKPQADAVKAYIAANNYNTEYVFLIDMSIPSGKKRFFIYNLKTDQIIESALVTHGFGSRVRGSDESLQFSNEASSLQTSLGRYKIGSSYNGNFGLSYKLFGLDKTNSNAYARAIVIHAHKSIPTTEIYPVLIGESFGCPSVAPSFLDTLTKYIKGSSKPVMMWIYN
ncbi:MAG: murein L,D-transpeptidase catalytic domain-containing protein [Ferruginibacter sp.]